MCMSVSGSNPIHGMAGLSNAQRQAVVGKKPDAAARKDERKVERPGDRVEFEHADERADDNSRDRREHPKDQPSSERLDVEG